MTINGIIALATEINEVDKCGKISRSYSTSNNRLVIDAAIRKIARLDNTNPISTALREIREQKIRTIRLVSFSPSVSLKWVIARPTDLISSRCVLHIAKKKPAIHNHWKIGTDFIHLLVYKSIMRGSETDSRRPIMKHETKDTAS